MRAVLGIDAAWTMTQPSGVALVIENSNGWELRAVAASYRAFCSIAEGNAVSHSNPAPGAQEVLTAASALAGLPVDLIAVDMPLSRTPIQARRASDDSVSRAYGQRWASTHTPSAFRPGAVSDALRFGYEQRGYELRTSGDVSSGLVEVYPHPALIEFAASERRLPYKFGNRRKYWPDEPRYVRLLNIWREMRTIVGLLDNEVAGVEQALSAFNWEAASAKEWKAYEDMLDAVVCAAVGICVLDGRAIPFGDENSAIWVPKPGCAKPAHVKDTITVRSGSAV
ncbi:DUF429 domain-containing protein [Mesorhizobium sp. M7A.F.Ca.US.006.01.1.1]|uniref:DUF429 domain-containing protein n=1 Tax=Mesorhizobium sp. M7A.F.Ca.US.006.01.1.1 TaxID=2496707 RepID=UPI000FCAED7B|nr:DUF429 domain-containing protein [Mesorhizobium sp. M7A.F.Ca.US.006.01.1.1]RUZ81270.1 DUF429 domain-containing protein [Mesorhizobium sp. M7A.F.Ca.US.006.01.1.1]